MRVNLRLFDGPMGCRRCRHSWETRGLDTARKVVVCPICGEHNDIGQAILAGRVEAELIPVRQPLVRTVSTRRHIYPFRRHAHSFTKHGQLEYRDDPGGVGQQIVREQWVSQKQAQSMLLKDFVMGAK